jgi:hypothetical protein
MFHIFENYHHLNYFYTNYQVPERRYKVYLQIK